MLPLWSHVIFVDWHGVLPNEVFWRSILVSRRHPPARPVAGADGWPVQRRPSHLEGVDKGAPLVRRAHLSDAYQVTPRFKADYLHRRLAADCRRMRVNVELVALLRRYRSKALVVVATDKMDCVADAFNALRKRRSRRRGAADTLAAWAADCDDLLCSSEIGRLKGEDPKPSFRPWLSAHGLTFSEAILLDGQQDNCEAFVLAGGSAIQWKLGRTRSVYWPSPFSAGSRRILNRAGANVG
jgi:hypothetical protein